MKLKIKRKSLPGVVARQKRKVRIRKKITGTGERPRLVVFRSLRYIYAQVVDDVTGKTLAAASSQKLEASGAAKGKNGKEVAKMIGSEIGKLASGKNIKSVVFDRSGYAYHGRIQALADAAREAGLSF